jgi:hypothetical protein
MADQIKEYCGEELSTFQLKRVIRAMAQKYPMPITAYIPHSLTRSSGLKPYTQCLVFEFSPAQSPAQSHTT